ncbi:hypothetical protein SASPL_143769 [Salvia splendens]|uniref:Alliinase C-terminal domain-containing protein n=1 Tax=Salvia splendens TaxID=180675 RepID=A0A8X8WMN4_SALSN|nr:hypothetical protein SASPL_143769 [Salvia splendens]
MVGTEAAVVIESSVPSDVAASVAAVAMAAATEVEVIKTTESKLTNLKIQTVPILDFDNPKLLLQPQEFCWYMLPKLEQEIKNLHNWVGNAVVEGRHFVVGNGSSQLIQAALYAPAKPLDPPSPISVVSAAPFYSCYPQIASYMRSRLFEWGGDAYAYNDDKAYIEMVTSRTILMDMQGRGSGKGPKNTLVFMALNAIVYMFMEISTIGVSKEAQLRAITILSMISTNSCPSNFFEFGRSVMAERWKKLREALQGTVNTATSHTTTTNAIQAQEGVNLEEVTKEEKIRVRAGGTFGCPNNYARISMLGRDKDVDLLLKRLPSIFKRLAL